MLYIDIPHLERLYQTLTQLAEKHADMSHPEIVREYKTWMVDPLGALTPALAAAIKSQLEGLFKTIIDKDKFFTSNSVSFSAGSAAPTAHELLVYFMPSGKSVIKNVPGAKAPDLDAGGNTVYAAGASEVYARGDDAAGLARLAFHELMHNRLKQDDGTLHPQEGLGGKIISTGTQLNEKNISSMSKVLQEPITQWTAGIAILNNGKNDPMSEYLKL